MPQSDTPDPDAPREPIIIIGRGDYYVTFPATVRAAIALVNRPREGDFESVPPVHDLDFFDALGRALEPIVVGGRLVSLAVRNSQDEIRYRVGRFHHYLTVGVGRGDGPPAPRPFSDPELDFESSVRKIAAEEEALVARDCNWWRHFFGLC